MFGCAQPLLLHAGFLYLRRVGLPSRGSAWASHCSGFSCCRVQAPGGQAQGGEWAYCSAACGIFLEQGLNLCPLYGQVDSYALYHQGSPR